ncbi:MAG: hypothetical protein A2527_14100 [Candidatus Lambdaproteobacteria bacterium RIFOXYD2_FULL_50_16]|uniref:Uncharacterized protein n=1 Tax=Candidatus Lambdaproteobacteria bacterium RIFOXYD2_FULL_50_16 TaxID=1817772 RepID=A0A1F6G4M4_9PROT|nr:MAG: hypothetical protein A2527_14100 [Candidatus Lambdaproteobacteria bacterium RIFOXYD2_FULL_50_16]
MADLNAAKGMAWDQQALDLKLTGHIFEQVEGLAAYGQAFQILVRQLAFEFKLVNATLDQAAKKMPSLIEAIETRLHWVEVGGVTANYEKSTGQIKIGATISGVDGPGVAAFLTTLRS